MKKNQTMEKYKLKTQKHIKKLNLKKKKQQRRNEEDERR
jgi:hypothetical protein